MSVSYDYDENSAGKADDVANRIDKSDAYIGKFKNAHAIKSANTGTEGIHFEFEAPGGGNAGFDVYTRKADGSQIFGGNQVNAMQAVLGLRGLRSQPGKHNAFVEGKLVEVDGEVFPDLCGKDIGLVLQKEHYTKSDGNHSFRMNLFGVFQASTKLTASELKDRKTTPEKLPKMLRGLKDKDSRVAATPEPSQPTVGAESGSY